MILPKTQSADDVAAVASKVGGNVAVLALIETGRGMANAHAISQGATGRLVFGTIDFQLDLGIDGDDMELLHFRSMLVLASRCAGLPPPCDGVTASIGDDIALATGCAAQSAVWLWRQTVHTSAADLTGQPGLYARRGCMCLGYARACRSGHCRRIGDRARRQNGGPACRGTRTTHP